MQLAEVTQKIDLLDFDLQTIDVVKIISVIILNLSKLCMVETAAKERMRLLKNIIRQEDGSGLINVLAKLFVFIDFEI